MTVHPETPSFREAAHPSEDSLSLAVDGPSTAVAARANERPLSVGERHRIAGETLDVCLERVGTLPPIIAAELGVKIARAVAELHASGQVHHALRPSTIFCAQSGNELLVRVVRSKTSWGSAAPSTSSGAGRRPALAAFELATPAYLAPEQIDGRRIDARTDVYALGVILYQCLVGRLPYDASTMVELAAAIASGQPVGLPSTIDPDLAAIVTRAISYDVAARFASPADLAEALAAWAREARRLASLLAAFLGVPVAEPRLPMAPSTPEDGTDATRKFDSHAPPNMAFARQLVFGGLPTLAAPIRVNPEDYDRRDVRVNALQIAPVVVLRD